jgi:hypothetical protein
MYRLFWGNEGICDLFTEARSAEVNKHISPTTSSAGHTARNEYARSQVEIWDEGLRSIPEVPQNNVLIFHIECEVALMSQNINNQLMPYCLRDVAFSHFLCCKDNTGEY